ncbi:hypothetical protein E0504_21535 [Parafrankia sp. BMG5.11]|nr:hypothetical protein E0504_21535 [Parafrankia sp. BMG5.11]
MSTIIVAGADPTHHTSADGFGRLRPSQGAVLGPQNGHDPPGMAGGPVVPPGVRMIASSAPDGGPPPAPRDADGAGGNVS